MCWLLHIRSVVLSRVPWLKCIRAPSETLRRVDSIVPLSPHRPARTRTRPRTIRFDRPVYQCAGVEVLEPRLAVSSLWYDPIDHFLVITSDAVSSDDFDSASIGHDSEGNLLVNGQTLCAGSSSNPVAASDVQAISLIMSGGSFDAELSGIDGEFSSLFMINFQVAAGSNNIYLSVGASGAMISGASGASGYVGYSGGVPITYLVGSGSTSGDNIVYGYGDNDAILDGGGVGTNNVIYGSYGNYTLNDGGGSNLIYSGGGTNTLNATEGVNVLDARADSNYGFAGGGTNVLNAAGGENTLFGGSGSDQFVDLGGGLNTLVAPSGITITGAGGRYNIANTAPTPVTLDVNVSTDGSGVTMTTGSDSYRGPAGPLTTGTAGHLGLIFPDQEVRLLRDPTSTMVPRTLRAARSR